MRDDQMSVEGRTRGVHGLYWQWIASNEAQVPAGNASVVLVHGPPAAAPALTTARAQCQPTLRFLTGSSGDFPCENAPIPRDLNG
jgi:hypothetical protein